MITPTSDEQRQGSYAWHFLLGYLSTTGEQLGAPMVEVAKGLGLEVEKMDARTREMLAAMGADL